MGWVEDARMSWLAPSGVHGWLVTAIIPVGPASVHSVLVGLAPMEPSSPMDRVEAALTATTPHGALLGLARELRDGAMSQAELLALFDAARERHAGDADETNYKAILDTMDLIAGWCSPSQKLYPDSEKPA
jgi:hypothetical protein